MPNKNNLYIKRKGKNLGTKLGSLHYILFFISQIYIIYLFINFGRDNEEYNRLLIEGGVDYLEPFWQFYAYLFNLLKIYVSIDPSYGLLFILLISSFFCYKKAVNGINKNFVIVIIIAAIFSYQISLVTGALRQGISFFLFLLYIIDRSKKYLFLSVATHWSGIFYLVFLRLTKKIIIAILVSLLTLSLLNLSFIASLIYRLNNYIELERVSNYPFIVGLIIIKFITAYIFFKNKIFLLRKINSNFLVNSIIFSPFIQLIIYFMIPSPVITDRANLILDPFILSGYILVANEVNFFTRFILVILIAIKISLRLIAATQASI